MILRKDKPKFEAQVEGLRVAVEDFKKVVQSKLQATIDRNRDSLRAVLLPRLIENPPKGWSPPGGSRPDPDRVARRLETTLRRAFGSAEQLVGEMKVKLVFKAVTYESLKDPAFMDAANTAIPELEKLYQEHEAARASEP